MHDPLDKFDRDSISPFKYLFNKDLEGAKSDLRREVAAFTRHVGINTFPCRGQRGERWRETYTEDVVMQHPELMDDIKKMNDLLYQVWDAYCEYIRIARKALIAS